jgi:uncharacterized protein YgbK (DUF1537 family)
MSSPFVPDRPIFSYYGDDFTGSTDALEALAENGVPSVLFLRLPDAGDLCKFSGCRAIGIAGESRSRPPAWMRAELPRVFETLRQIGAPVLQYKVCSTFDSSPEAGSIGCAIEIGREVFGNRSVGVVPAAPLLRRYVVFGNLFAAAGQAIHRIDRHPAMGAHPITPMDEGDLRLHLARQTSLEIAGVNLFELRANTWQWPERAGMVLFDGLDPEDMAQAARRIWEHRGTQQTFVAGSSGFTYGLMDYWHAQGWLPQTNGHATEARGNDGRLLVLSGSCSPATEVQIRTALQAGFHGIRLNPADLNPAAAEAEAVARLAEGRSVILYSGLGEAGRVAIDDRLALAKAMGRLLRKVMLASVVRRAVVAGGDTSSHAAQELGVSALTFVAPLARGAPLCRAHGWPGELDLVLKGGQVGLPSFFEDVRSWGAKG